MFEDLARNLEVPKRLGMRTVLIVPENFETTLGDAWEHEGREGAHIDFVTDDLTRSCAASAAPPPDRRKDPGASPHRGPSVGSPGRRPRRAVVTRWSSPSCRCSRRARRRSRPSSRSEPVVEVAVVDAGAGRGRPSRFRRAGCSGTWPTPEMRSTRSSARRFWSRVGTWPASVTSRSFTVTLDVRGVDVVVVGQAVVDVVASDRPNGCSPSGRGRRTACRPRGDARRRGRRTTRRSLVAGALDEAAFFAASVS